jgi:hypothetical protein
LLLKLKAGSFIIDFKRPEHKPVSFIVQALRCMAIDIVIHVVPSNRRRHSFGAVANSDIPVVAAAAAAAAAATTIQTTFACRVKFVTRCPKFGCAAASAAGFFFPIVLCNA